MEILERLHEPAGEPRGALVLMHGRGVDESDLLPLLDVLDPRRELAGAAPRGPFELPPGGRHWYVSRTPPHPDPDTFRETYAALCDWVDALEQTTGVPLARTLLGGFSQGSVMAYAVSLGPRRPRPAGILAMSGFLPKVPDFELPLEGLDGLPVAITHGAADPVIDVRFGRDAAGRLREAGADVLYLESPGMAHSVDPRALGQLGEWIDGALARAG